MSIVRLAKRFKNLKRVKFKILIFKSGWIECCLFLLQILGGSTVGNVEFWKQLYEWVRQNSSNLTNITVYATIYTSDQRRAIQRRWQATRSPNSRDVRTRAVSVLYNSKLHSNIHATIQCCTVSISDKLQAWGAVTWTNICWSDKHNIFVMLFGRWRYAFITNSVILSFISSPGVGLQINCTDCFSDARFNTTFNANCQNDAY